MIRASPLRWRPPATWQEGRCKAKSYYSLSIATTVVTDDDAGARGALMPTVIGSRAHDEGPACPHPTTHPIPPPPLTCTCSPLTASPSRMVTTSWRSPYPSQRAINPFLVRHRHLRQT